jgi:uncharacterized membrane protein
MFNKPFRSSALMKATFQFLLAMFQWTILIAAWMLVFNAPSHKLTWDDANRLAPSLLLALVGSLLLQAVVSRLRTTTRAIFVGLLLGFLLPIIAGFLIMKLTGGFESSAIFALGLLLSVPSSIGGALGGWILFRSRPVSSDN